MGSNMGVYSGIEPLSSGGQRDPQQAYAPHGYDLVVDTARIASASAERKSSFLPDTRKPPNAGIGRCWWENGELTACSPALCRLPEMLSASTSGCYAATPIGLTNQRSRWQTASLPSGGPTRSG